MAQEKITIKFIPDGNVALVKAIKELNKATRQLNGQLNKLNKSNVAVAKSQTLVQQRVGATTKAANASSTAFTRLQATISVYRNKMLLAGFATALIVRPLMNLVKLSADFQDLERGFEGLGRSIEASSEHLNKLREATNGTVDDMELMRQANNALMLGIVENEDEMAQLFDTAQRLGQALGRDTVSSIESMVTGMGRQSRLMLDNIGIIVKSETAYKRFAKEQGILAKNLTDVQKKTAFNNEVLRQSRIIVEGLGDEVLSTNAHIARLQVATIKLGREFGLVLEPLVIGLSHTLVFLANIIDANLIKSIVVASTIVGVLTIAINSFTVSSKIAIMTTFVFEGAIKAFTLATTIATKGVMAFTASLAANPLFKKAIIIAGAFTAVAVALNKFVFTQEDANDSAHEGMLVFGGVAKSTFDYKDSLDALDKAFKNTNEGQLEHLDNLILDAQATKMFNGLNEDQEKGLTALIKQRDDLKKKIHESTDAGKAEVAAIKASENAYNSTSEAQIKLLNSQIKIIESLDATDPANQKAIAGLDSLKNKLNELVAESGRIDILGENLTQTLETISGFLDEQVALTQASAEARIKIFDDEANAEIAAKKKSRGFDRLSAKQQEDALASIREAAEKKKQKERDKANKQMAIQFRLNQILAIRDAVSNTSVAYTKALAQGGFVLGIGMANVVAALGAVQVASIAAQKPPKMEQGGLIGGRRHSQGGTLIEAEQGEFVMNRNAVDAIGVENLNRMNRGGGAPVSISFSGNVMSDDFIENEAIPKIKEAVRRGSDIGVS
jgi:hypothetical protein